MVTSTVSRLTTALLMLLVAVAAVTGFAFGSKVGAGPRMSALQVFRDAPAQVGDGQASASIDGVTYGFRGEVAWVDAAASWHEDGWPACLERIGPAVMTFGGAVIYGPTGAGSYRILWVDCRQ